MVAGRIPRVLSIAGSDSGGGAGIQADLKAFAACGVHGMTAITAITAQSTVGVTAVHPVPPEVILAQVAAVAQDIGVDAVKIGMLGDAHGRGGRAALDELPDGVPVVLDPVMVAESGAELLAARRAAGAGRAAAAASDRRDPERARGEGAGGVGWGGAAAGGPDRTLARRPLAGSTRSAPSAVVVTGGHREQADRRVLRRGAARRAPGRAPPLGCGARFRAALTRRCSRRGSPGATIRSRRPASRGRWPRERCATGLRELGAGAGPVDVLGISRVRS